MQQQRNVTVPAVLTLVALFAASPLIPLAHAGGDVVLIPCNNPGDQGTIRSAYVIVPTGTGWNPYPDYYVYGNRERYDVDAYNYCLFGNQVGAVEVDYEGRTAYATCVTCFHPEFESATLLP